MVIFEYHHHCNGCCENWLVGLDWTAGAVGMGWLNLWRWEGRVYVNYRRARRFHQQWLAALQNCGVYLIPDFPMEICY